MVIILLISRTTSSTRPCSRLRNSLLQKLKGWIIRRNYSGVYELWRGLCRNLILDLSISHLLACGSKLGFILVNLTVSNMVVLCPFGPSIRSRGRHLGVTEWEKMVFLGSWWFLRRRREELLKVAVFILGHRHTIFNELWFSLLLGIMIGCVHSFLFCNLQLFWVIKWTHLNWLLRKWILLQLNIDTIKRKWIWVST